MCLSVHASPESCPPTASSAPPPASAHLHPPPAHPHTRQQCVRRSAHTASSRRVSIEVLHAQHEVREAHFRTGR
eukprot:scaffold11474_cov26-Tisochrysis_lutea.AAC.1